MTLRQIDSGIDPMVCFVCARRVDALADDADGWVPYNRSIEDGDRSDDPGWLCPDHATPSDELEAEQRMAKAWADPTNPPPPDRASRCLGYGRRPLDPPVAHPSRPVDLTRLYLYLTVRVDQPGSTLCLLSPPASRPPRAPPDLNPV